MVEVKLDVEKVVFTDHALDQLQKRFKKLYNQELNNPLKTAKKLLANASPDGAINPVEKVKRMITHKFEEVLYLYNSGWRFVISIDEPPRVITIERGLQYVEKKRKKRKKTRRRF